MVCWALVAASVACSGGVQKTSASGLPDASCWTGWLTSVSVVLIRLLAGSVMLALSSSLLSAVAPSRP